MTDRHCRPRACPWAGVGLIVASLLIASYSLPGYALETDAADPPAAVDTTPSNAMPDAADSESSDAAPVRETHAAQEADAPELEDLHAHHQVVAEGFQRSQAGYSIPDLSLTNQAGETVALSRLLDSDRPVMLNFIYTACTAICPAMTGIFAEVERTLGDDDRSRVSLVSISIDPEHDTPEQLTAYAQRFGAGPEWQFLTGSLEDSIAIQRAFDAYRGDKMNHTPLTLLHASAGAPWIRFDGFAPATTLTDELRKMLPTTAATVPVADADVYFAAYAFGTRLAQLRAAGTTLPMETVLRGMLDALSDTPARMAPTAQGAAQAAPDAPAPQPGVPVSPFGFTGDDYAALNARRPGVVVLPGGTQYEVLTPGTGRQPRESDSVLVRYTGKLTNGNVFDTTYEDAADEATEESHQADADAPGEHDSIRLKLSEITVPGLRDALLQMTEGARWRVVIPPGQGFAGTGTKMLRNRDLIYEIELLKVLASDQATATEQNSEH